MIAWPLFGIWLACLYVRRNERVFSKKWYRNQYLVLLPAMVVSLYLAYLGG